MNESRERMMWELLSPDGSTRTRVLRGDAGLVLEIEKRGAPVATILLGLTVGGLPLADGSAAVSEQRERIHERYRLPVGKLDEYENDANELLLYFAHWRLRMRASLSGVAFRYELPGEGTLTVESEATSFAFAEGFDTLYAQELFSTYERPYLKRDWEDTDEQPYGLPALLSDGRLWLLLSEAELLSTGEYCSCHVVGSGARHTLRFAFAREQNSRPIEASLPFHTPWRCLTIAEGLNELVRSHFNYDLNPPSAIADSSWVRPARALWAWWEYENGAQLYTESKRYVDTAAAMGFEAVVLDCGWDANWVEPLCSYAHQRGVQLWLWTDRHRVDTREGMERYLPLWASWGVDGLKIDFFEDDSQQTMRAYRMLLERSASLKLMVNLHGATKPMGEGRTWQHFMTSEGIMGLEHYKWSDMPNAMHNCTVPFTRNVCGPMDYTPIGLCNKNRNTTHAHQLALSVVFESGVTHYALSVYRLEAWKGSRFLRRTKAKYDDMRLLAGRPGCEAVMLRRKDDEYFIGAITDAKQELTLTLDFLPDGDFWAEIYEDSEKDEMLLMRTCQVNNAQALRLPLMLHGGAAVYIARALSEPTATESGSTLLRELMPSDGRLSGGSEPMRLPDGEDAILLYGKAAFELIVPRKGRYTLRLFYTSEAPCQLMLESGADTRLELLPQSGGHYEAITHDCVLTLPQGVSKLLLSRANGDAPALIKAQLCNDHPTEKREYPAQAARLTGKAELAELEQGVPQAVGLGEGAEIVFENVEADEDGTYVLSIRYCGGESRDISIQIGHQPPIHTYLHSTAGWGFPTWLNAEEKEVLVRLAKGTNTVRLYCDHAPMSHIRGISVCPDPCGAKKRTAI